MRALVLGSSATLVDDHPEPRRGPGEAVIRMTAAGLCDTDLQLVKGYMGYRGVLGHEAIGEVIASSDPSWLGRRVVADINASCGQCEDCVTRDGHHCALRTVVGILGRDGALAERFAVPERCLVAVPDHLADEVGVFAEPVAAALHVQDDTLPGPVIVLGDGKLGLLVALTLLSSGRDVMVVGRHASKLSIAAAKGAATCLERDLGRDLARSPNVVEATGTAGGLTLALRLVLPRGRVILKSTVAIPEGLDLGPLVVNEIQLVGSRCGDMKAAVAALAAGTVEPSPLLTARYPLSEADLALEHAGRRGALKVIVHG